MSYKTLLKRLVLFAVILAIAMATRMIILGGKPEVNLSTAPAMAAAVSRGLGQTGSGSPYLQQEGKDYKLRSVSYFYNKEWVVVKVLPVKNNGDVAFLVLKKINGIYQSVLGPASTFNASYFYVMPLDVQKYLVAQGAYSG